MCDRSLRLAGRNSGFTLLEVLVALAILSLTGAAIYEALAWSLRRSGDLKQKEIALLTAQSLLERVRGDEWQPTTTRTHGRSTEGFEWEISVSPHTVDGVEDMHVKPFDVEIVVGHQRAGNSIVIRSVELLTSSAP